MAQIPKKVYTPRSVRLTCENYKKQNRSWYYQVLFFANVHVYCEHLFITNSLKIIKINIDHFPLKRVIVLNEAYKFKEEKDSSLLLYCYLIFFVINRRSQYT